MEKEGQAVFPKIDIPCTNCDLAYFNGENEPKKGSCMAFPIKPPEILFEGEKCPYFVDRS